MEDGPINVSALAPGTRLNNGNYTIVEKIGEGGFGITYRALQNNLNRTVCINHSHRDKWRVLREVPSGLRP